MILKKSHICIDCRMIHHSGIGKYLLKIVKGLLKSGKFKITLLGNKEVLMRCFNNFEFEVIKFNVPIYSVKEQFLFLFYIPKCDIFWSPHYNVPFLPIRASKRIVTIHDVYHLAFYREISFLQVVYSRLMLTFAAFFSHEIITVSEFSKSEILHFLGKSLAKKVKVIYNGVDFNNNRYSKKSLNKRPYLLFVGNIKPHKNLKNALLAFEEICVDFPEIDLYLVGKKEGFINGSEVSYKTMLEKNKSRVMFTGWVSEEDLKGYYENALAFIFPSLYEGFGLPPLEAMSFSCPTIVSDIPVLKEICAESSLYFDPNNLDDIVKTMRLIITSKEIRDKLVNNGIKRVEKFSWTFSIDTHIKVFSKI